MLKRGDFVLLVIVLIIIISNPVNASLAANVKSPFLYSFNTNGILQESATEQLSTSPYWWLNSGAKLIISDGRGKTIQNELSPTDKWRLIYFNSNPIDTDDGYHPQNIFRLFTRSKWKNFKEIAYFKITKDQLSNSPNRDAYNGLLLINRFQDNGDLYYAGIRVDGNAVIKKKLNGRYYTLASKKIFPGTYSRLLNPSLLPKNTWIGLKSQINNTNGKVNIKLYMDKNWNLNWTLILEANDPGGSYGAPILNEGTAGIRTDFMDVIFDDYRLISI